MISARQSDAHAELNKKPTPPPPVAEKPQQESPPVVPQPASYSKNPVSAAAPGPVSQGPYQSLQPNVFAGRFPQTSFMSPGMGGFQENMMMGPPRRQFIDGGENGMYCGGGGYVFPQQHYSAEDFFRYYRYYSALCSQFAAPPAYYLPQSSDYIQLMRPNFININNVNTLGNALIISGNHNAQVNLPAAPQQVVAAAPDPVPTQKEESEIFRVDVNYEYYRKRYLGAV